MTVTYSLFSRSRCPHIYDLRQHLHYSFFLFTHSTQWSKSVNHVQSNMQYAHCTSSLFTINHYHFFFYLINISPDSSSAPCRTGARHIYIVQVSDLDFRMNFLMFLWQLERVWAEFELVVLRFLHWHLPSLGFVQQLSSLISSTCNNFSLLVIEHLSYTLLYTTKLTEEKRVRILSTITLINDELMSIYRHTVLC